MGFRLGKALGSLVKSVVPGAGAASTIAGLVKSNKSAKGGSASMGGTVMSTAAASSAIPTFKNTAGMATCTAVFDRGKTRMTHPNKSTYITRGGGTSHWPQKLLLHPAGTECVTRRRINAGNGRAAVRAVRRLVAFYSLSQRVAKQLRKAASKAHLHRGSQRRLPSGRGGVEVVNVD